MRNKLVIPMWTFPNYPTDLRISPITASKTLSFCLRQNWAESHYASQADLELQIFLQWTPKQWNYSHVLLCSQMPFPLCLRILIIPCEIIIDYKLNNRLELNLLLDCMTQSHWEINYMQQIYTCNSHLIVFILNSGSFSLLKDTLITLLGKTQ